MSDSSSFSSNWWEGISVYESNYVPDSYTPGSSVEANHNLLGGLRENDFDTADQDYTYGLLALAIVFLVAGMLSCCLLPLLYRCLSKSNKERLAERLEIGHRSYAKGSLRANLLMLIAVLAALATAAGAVWGLAEADSGLTIIEDDTQDITDDLRVVLSLPNDTSVALTSLSASYDSLLNNVDNCTSASTYGVASNYINNMLSADEMTAFIETMEAAVTILDSDVLDDLANDVEGVSEAIETTRGIRKGVVWPVLSLSLLVIIIFLVSALGIYELIACQIADCKRISRCISPCTIFLAVIIWISAASAVTMSALSGDFCIDPDANVQTLLIADTVDDDMVQLVEYYTGDCTTQNDAIDVIIAAQGIAVEYINTTLPALYMIADFCAEDISSYVQEVDSSMFGLWTVLDDAGKLTSCENLNGPYQEVVYEELCTNVPKGLLGFWVSCVIFTVLLLILVSLWNKMLRERRTDEHATAMEERQQPRWIDGMWNSVRRSSKHEGGPGSQHGHGAPPVQRPVEISNPQREGRGEQHRGSRL